MIGYKSILAENMKSISCFIAISLLTSFSCQKPIASEKIHDRKYEVTKTEKQWRSLLSSQTYEVMREKGTELPFTNDYHDLKEIGRFVCASCGNQLFISQTKFDSGTGWPSFYQPANSNSVDENLDTSHGMSRREVICKRCGGHLGHVFTDGPSPTGLRYCINSVALKFVKEELLKGK